jgi:5-methylcytosine-specific restriction enzyme subunit McrC
MMDFLDEQRMCRLYEKFILEYYKKHYPHIRVAPSQIDWALDDGIGAMLPTMQSDITLSYHNGGVERTLIIDAKYYSHTTQSQYGVNTLHSGNLYQIFTYVKNKDAEYGDEPHTVSGMLLYAQTDENVQPNHVYQMSGNQISVRTLNLNLPFKEIAAQLDEIAEMHFSKK